MKLYELTQNYKNLLDLLEDDNIPIELLEDSLNQINEDFTSKCESISKVIKSLYANIDAIRMEERRLQKRRKAIENNMNNLKDYLKTSMEALDKKSVKSNMFSLSIRKNTPSILIKNINDIPEEYVKEVIEYDIDKKGILQEFKSTGYLVEGVEIKESESLFII